MLLMKMYPCAKFLKKICAIVIYLIESVSEGFPTYSFISDGVRSRLLAVKWSPHFNMVQIIFFVLVIRVHVVRTESV